MKKWISVMMAAALAASLCACGAPASSPAADTADTSTAATDGGDTAETAGNTADTGADSDLAYIQANGKMTIGYTVYAPMNYTDENGEFVGFDTELATAVCE